MRSARSDRAGARDQPDQQSPPDEPDGEDGRFELQIVLPDPVAAQEPLSTLAGVMVRREVALANNDRHTRPLRPAPPLPAATPDGERARWLEPYGTDPAWRKQMWGQIVALYGRYPRHLAALKDDWWNDDTHTEILCALATWRTELDDSGLDPREELAFHNQLEDYAHSLRQQGGGVTKAWQPDAPPPDRSNS